MEPEPQTVFLLLSPNAGRCGIIRFQYITQQESWLAVTGTADLFVNNVRSEAASALVNGGEGVRLYIFELGIWDAAELNRYLLTHRDSVVINATCDSAAPVCGLVASLRAPNIAGGWLRTSPEWKANATVQVCAMCGLWCPECVSGFEGRRGWKCFVCHRRVRIRNRGHIERPERRPKGVHRNETSEGKGHKQRISWDTSPPFPLAPCGPCNTSIPADCAARSHVSLLCRRPADAERVLSSGL